MTKVLSYIFLGILTSMYFYNFGFTFLPTSINTKMILAVFGIPMAAYQIIKSDRFSIDKGFLGAIMLAVLFSVCCLFAVDLNNTNDFSYASYIVSFSTWMFSSYFLCACIKEVHGNIDIKTVTFYLAGVSAAQCISAIIIDNVPQFKLLVDSYIFMGQEFLDEVDRLYGLGASLDGAGVRFCIVLSLIAAVLNNEKTVNQSNIRILYLVVSYFIILVIGNMISRLTTVGVGISVVCFVLGRIIAQGRYSISVRKVNIIIFVSVIWTIVLTTFFYNTNETVHDQLRFGFEGFFNWIEQGEWRTDSTDKLNREMWVWPTDTHTWIIGSGFFDNWMFGTDIGYCRFILYCGIIGFSIFCLFFIYNAYAMGKRFPGYQFLFFILGLLSFIIWIKVSTDIFLIYGILYSVSMLQKKETLQSTPNLLQIA